MLASVFAVVISVLLGLTQTISVASALGFALGLVGIQIPLLTYKKGGTVR
jgi:hypothetical protein